MLRFIFVRVCGFFETMSNRFDTLINITSTPSDRCSRTNARRCCTRKHIQLFVLLALSQIIYMCVILQYSCIAHYYSGRFE